MGPRRPVGLWGPIPTRSAPSGWGRPETEETEPTRTGSGLAGPTRCNARAKRWIQAQSSVNASTAVAAASFAATEQFTAFTIARSDAVRIEPWTATPQNASSSTSAST